MLRFIVSVITGYLVFAICATLWFQFTGQDPHASTTILFGVVSVLYGIVCAVAGGLVAARFAPRKSQAAGMFVAVLIAAGAVLSLAMDGKHGRIWSQLSALLLMAPAAWLGGVLYGKRKAPAEAPVTNTPG
jgi:hypothetical protein